MKLDTFHLSWLHSFLKDKAAEMGWAKDCHTPSWDEILNLVPAETAAALRKQPELLYLLRLALLEWLRAESYRE